MAKYHVYTDVIVSVGIEVVVPDSDSDSELVAAFKKAQEKFGGLQGYCGNGGVNKLIGVQGRTESIHCDNTKVNFQFAEKINGGEGGALAPPSPLSVGT